MASKSEFALDATHCTTAILINVSSFIEKDWKRLGRQLGLEEADLEEIEDAYRNYGLDEMAYQVMLLWQRNVGKDATISTLQTNLEAIGRADIIFNISDLATAMEKVTISCKSSNGQEAPNHSVASQLLKEIQEKLRRQYRSLEMKGLPWMEDIVLTLDEYYVDLTMSKMTRSGRVLPSASIKIEEIFISDGKETAPTRILVEGGPGRGKSTLAAKLAYDWAKGEPYMNSFDFVLLLPLRHMTEEFEETVRRATCANIKDKANIVDILSDRSKRLLLILDGFDESSSETEKSVLPLIESVILPHVIVVVTSRPGKFTLKRGMLNPDMCTETLGLLENADISPTSSYFIDSRVYIEGFTAQQQVMFMEKHLKCFSDEQKQNIQSKVHKLIDKEFLNCPLFLLMLVMVFTNNPEDDKHVENVTDLYKQVFNNVIRRYLSKTNKNQPLPEIDVFSFEGCRKSTHHDLANQFSNFALLMGWCESLTFSREHILRMEGCDERVLDLGFLTQTLQVNGLREKVVYEPVHRTLLEFAAAYAVRVLFEMNEFEFWKQNVISFRPRLGQRRQLCFPFLAGLMGTQVTSLFNVLRPYAAEYAADFGLLVSTLKEIEITDEMLNIMIPFLPVKWSIPWLQKSNGFSSIPWTANDNGFASPFFETDTGPTSSPFFTTDTGFAMSHQHEALVRLGTVTGRIKFIQWHLLHQALLPNDIELETIACDIAFCNSAYLPSLHKKRIHCKDLWFIFPPFVMDIDQTMVLYAQDLIESKRISCTCNVPLDFLPNVDKILKQSYGQLNWFKVNNAFVQSMDDNFICNTTKLVTAQYISRLEISVDGNTPQEQIDSLVKCCGKSTSLNSFILRSRKFSDFYVDLVQLCDGGRKSWNWLHLEGIQVRCNQVITCSDNIRHLFLELCGLSVRLNFQCCGMSSLALPGSLLTSVCDMWNLANSLQELNIIVEHSFTHDGFQSLPKRFQNLKTLVLTMTAFEYKFDCMLITGWILNLSPTLNRIEIWKVASNPILAREIVHGVSRVLQESLKENVTPTKVNGSNASSSLLPGHVLQLPLRYFLLHMPVTNFEDELTPVDEIDIKSLEVFAPAFPQLKQCLLAKALTQLEIVCLLGAQRNPRIDMFALSMFFSAEDGFQLRRDLWGSRQDDSLSSKGMHDRCPGLLERFSIAFE